MKQEKYDTTVTFEKITEFECPMCDNKLYMVKIVSNYQPLVKCKTCGLFTSCDMHQWLMDNPDERKNLRDEYVRTGKVT